MFMLSNSFCAFSKLELKLISNFHPFLARCILQIHRSSNFGEDWSPNFECMIPLRLFAFNLLRSILQNGHVDKDINTIISNLLSNDANQFQRNLKLQLDSNQTTCKQMHVRKKLTLHFFKTEGTYAICFGADFQTIIYKSCSCLAIHSALSQN